VAGVDDDEESFAAGEEAARGEAEVDGVEELAAVAVAVAGGEVEGGVEGGGAEVVDLQVAGHGEEVEGTVEFRHGLVAEGGDDAAVEVTGRGPGGAR